MPLRPVYIAASIRTPFVKSLTTYRHETTQGLMTAALQGLVVKQNLQGMLIGDVGLGAVINSSSNWNLARECVLGTDLAPRTPGYTLQRACGTSLETTLQLALKISNYQIDTAIAGGVDSNSDLPIMAQRSLAQKLIDIRMAQGFAEKMKVIATLRPHDFKPYFPAVKEPRTGMSMGEHCELMVKEWGITREAQDQLALLLCAAILP